MKTNKVIIIGGGLAGLHCGLLLAKKGKEVTLLEQHTTVGGLAAGFNRKGYYFDSGIARFAGASLAGYFEEAGISSLVPLQDHRASVRMGDKTYKTRTVADFIQACANHFPAEAEALIRLYNEKIKEPAAFMSLQNQSGMLSYKGPKMMGKAFATMGKTIFGGHAGGMGALMKSMDTDLQDLLENYLGKDSPLADYLMHITGDLFNKGGRNSLMNLIGSLCSDLELDKYPQNGFQHLCNCYAEGIKKHGGKIITGAKALKIQCSGHTATAAEYALKGQTLTETGDAIVYAADLSTLYMQLLHGIKDESGLSGRIAEQETTAPVPILYLGVKLRGDIIREHFGDAEELIYHPERGKPAAEEDYYAAAPMILHCSSLNNPGHAPAGCSSIQVYLASPPKGWMDNWGMGNGGKTNEYGVIKKQVTRDVMENITRVLPKLEDGSLTEVCELGTPHTFERYTGNKGGAHCAFTWDRALNKVNPQMGRYNCRHATIENLYTIGHWTGYLGGATNALGSARHAAELIK